MSQKINIKNPIERTIEENIKNQNAVFVFPTQTVADLWADKTTLEEENSAVSMERFIAWDDFKGKAIRSQNQDKDSVPALMRQIFAANLIEKNATERFLKNLIIPRYAEDASGFTKWISKILPSLAIWKTKILDRTEFENNFAESENQIIELDDEDKDYKTLYELYKAFLDEHGLFDPAWETPPFTDDGREYYIIYPEILMDYAEYKPLLDATKKIHLVSTKELVNSNNESNTNTIDAIFYENTRVELTQTALYIRKLHEIDGIDWTKIAVNVPDLDTYSPYIEREFNLYEIPFVMRTGKTLSSTPAGNFFVQAQECVQSEFSFSSVKNLLLNNSLPWKDEKLNARFVTFGKENNCLCSYKYKNEEYDVWEQALKPGGKEAVDQRLVNLYKSLRYRLSDMVNAKTYKEINEAYFKFRNDFFDMSQCDVESDKIISRCIVALGELIDLEESFPDCKISNPYNFFQSHLADIKYVSQDATRGVQVFSYRLSAAAPFDCHIVIDASQDSLSVTSLYKQLSFLNETKRKRLGIEDIDPTEDFIRLYNVSENVKSRFSASEKTFTGYSFPHGIFEVEKKIPKLSDNFIPDIQYDVYSSERDFLLEKNDKDISRYQMKDDSTIYHYPNYVFKSIKKSFDNWKKNAIPNLTTFSSQNELKALIQEKIFTKSLFDKELNKYKISQSALKDFFLCPRYWLFNNLLKIDALDNEALLIDKFTMGKVYHDIFSFYCKHLKENDLPLKAEKYSLSDVYDNILKNSISYALNEFKTSHLSKQLLLTDENAIYDTMKNAVIEFSHWFNEYKVIESEKMYNSVPLNDDGTEKDYYLNGRIDCLLYNPSNEEYTLIDFKTSDMAIPKNMIFDISKYEELPDPQMPMYKQLIENPKSGKKYKIDNAGFFNIKEGTPKFVFGLASNYFEVDGHSKVPPKLANGKIETAKEFEETTKKFFEMTEEYINKIKSCDFEISEEKQSFNVCRDSDCQNFRAICRRFFNVSGR